MRRESPPRRGGDVRAGRHTPHSSQRNLMIKPATDTVHPLNLAVVYDDAASQHRASRLLERVTRLLGLDALSIAAWRISDLDHAEVLPQAVQAACEADII